MAKPKYTRDWQNKKSLTECMMNMLENEIMCDVTFRVGTDQSFVKAHKYMLASRSSVFNTMFEVSCPEKGEVFVPDVNLETFKVLLGYIYSDVLDTSLDNMQEVLHVAEKYQLSRMKDICSDQLLSSIETSNTHLVFDVASNCNLQSVKSKTLEHIQNNADKCLIAQNAIKMSRECMEVILKMDSIYCSETDICRFLIKWAGHQCEAAGKTASGKNMREITGSLLYLVRFTLVDKKYFTKEIAHSGFLTSKEVISVFSSHNGCPNEYFVRSDRNSKGEYEIVRRNSKETFKVWRRSSTSPLPTHSLNKKMKLKSDISFGQVSDKHKSISIRDRYFQQLKEGFNQ